MPRPNPLRLLQSEANLARRVAFEREQRQWTYEGTAKRMTDVGCAIQGSAIYKIEKGQPPRRISVDELVAFGKVFDLDLADLLVPVDVILDNHSKALVQAWLDARKALYDAWAQMDAADVNFREYVEQHPEAREPVYTAFAAAAAADPEAEADWYRKHPVAVDFGPPHTDKRKKA
jgi:transcriptional regulator with XRE-family HTH domain